MEHFQEVLNQPEPAIDLQIEYDAATVLLDINLSDISVSEVKDALKSMKNNKSPGLDDIPADLLKHGMETISEQLANLFSKMWREEKLLLIYINKMKNIKGLINN